MSSIRRPLALDGRRLLHRLNELGTIGRSPSGGLDRRALSPADGRGRDQLCSWLQSADLQVVIDAIGNIFGVWPHPGTITEPVRASVMIGSHIDTVADAGIFDGALGVLAGIEVVTALQRVGCRPDAPIVVAAFTNEEGVRFTPDMMGSLVHVGRLSLQEALEALAPDGARVGNDLARIGYAGTLAPGTIRPDIYLELHVEQGPVLADAGIAIGAVDQVQGLSWQRCTFVGEANHSGTTPMARRRDALIAASEVILAAQQLALRHPALRATVGSLTVEPNLVNVIPRQVSMTVDLRSPLPDILHAAEVDLGRDVGRIAERLGVDASCITLARVEPVSFDGSLVCTIEEAAAELNLSVLRMASGAGHDAQIMASAARTAMIFVPSREGISHSPGEFTSDEHVIAGATVLAATVSRVLGLA